MSEFELVNLVHQVIFEETHQNEGTKFYWHTEHLWIHSVIKSNSSPTRTLEYKYEPSPNTHEMNIHSLLLKFC